ncbi:leucine-rich repeat and immunoglobulin-like domain-containing nogo receptor-interacting protein 2 [Plakobranchus ocellatus]|uniref:Leucine-rich repeat and immunoglobulin-like domain-containing nogo receptor-interacting protein 2 n=1 Tax=Plakobranchus ocellatus TaxID=259542 RepID=A0AAV4BZI6_9GAST|nr:leucine-rich repeat and immunoglobulin-like domain-containing nogo receptor-interacting protein 2 [Plakobranchus ocellatus]
MCHFRDLCRLSLDDSVADIEQFTSKLLNVARPIALTSCLCKTFKGMVNDQLVHVLGVQKPAGKGALGFRRDHSTLDNLVNAYIHTIWQENWDAEEVNKLHEVLLNLGENLSRRGEVAGRKQEKEIQDQAFIQLPELKSLDLSQNKIGRLETGSLEGLDNLLSLNLSHNQLSDLGMALTDLEKLTSLDLSINSLKIIPEGTFTNLSSLTYLKLDGNPVRVLHARSFSGLSSLRELSMRDCSLKELDGEMFAFLPRLVILNLGHNRLHTYPPAIAFSGLQFLQAIYYDHNDIAVLEAESFSGLKLDVIDLSFNRIRELAAKTFAGARLAHLDISHNSVLSVSPDSLKPLGSALTRLSLAKNPIRILQPTVFSSLKVLSILNLSACHLESLPHDAVSDLESLKSLDASDNRIHFLSEGTLTLLEHVDVLKLSGNPWVCDCSIRALRDWLGKASNSARLSCQREAVAKQVDDKGEVCVQQIACAAPSGLLEQQVSKLSEEQLAMCEGDDSSAVPASTQGAIVASCMGFAIVLLIITIYLWRRGKTAHGLKRVCVPSDAESSHKDDDEDDKIPPLPDCRRSSLTNSDHNFVFRHYFDHLVTDPKLMSDDAEDLEESRDADDETAPLGKKERDSQYSSQNSVYSTRSDAAYGMESTV